MAKAKKLKEAFTPQAREVMERQIEGESKYLSELRSGDAPPAQVYPMSEGKVDLSIIEKRIAHQKKVLASGTPELATGKERERLEKRYKELREELPKRLLTHRQNDLGPKNGHEYNVAVRKAVRMEVGNAETQSMAREYRAIGAALDPENPEASSIEALRLEQ